MYLSIDEWINQFNKSTKNKDEFIIYILDEDKITPIKTKYKQDKTLAKGSVLRSVFKYPKLLDEIDMEILDLLTKVNYLIKGRVGYLILKTLCENAKLYTKDYKLLELSYKEIKAKISDKLELNIDCLLPTYPLMDIKGGVLFILDTKLNFDEMNMLLKSPKLSKQEHIEVYRFTQNILQIQTKKPKNYQIKTIKKRPKPKLILQANKYIQLVFLYDKYEIKAYPFAKSTTKQSIKGENVIIRDNEYEKEIINKIISFGFKDLQNTFISSDVASWKRFLDELKGLKKSGFIVEFVNFDMEFKEVKEITLQSDEADGWFSLCFEVNVGGDKYPLLPIIAPILKEVDNIEDLPDEICLSYDTNKYTTIKTKEIQGVLKTVFELFDYVNKDKIKIKKYNLHLLEIEDEVKYKKSNIFKLSHKLKNLKEIKQITPPKHLNLELRTYQKEGLNWLMFLREFGFGGILADDMGLGKTIQVLALLLKLKEQSKLKKPTLIVTPTSLIGNWKAEIEKFSPKLKYVAINGQNRIDKLKEIKKYDLVFSTYALIPKDLDYYKAKF